MFAEAWVAGDRVAYVLDFPMRSRAVTSQSST